MYQANVFVPNAELGIPRAEPDGPLDERDRLPDGSGEKLTLAESEVCEDPVSVQREHSLVLGNGLRVPALRPQHLTLGDVCQLAAGRCCYSLLAQRFRAFEID